MDLEEVIRDTLEIEAGPHDIEFGENEQQQQQQQQQQNDEHEQRLIQQTQQRQQEILLRQQQRPMRLIHEPSALRVNITTNLPKEVTIWLYYFSRSPSNPAVWKKIMTRTVLTMITANTRWWANPYLDSLVNKGLLDIMNVFPFDLFKDFVAMTPVNTTISYPTDSHEPFRYNHPIRNRGSKFPDIAVFANEQGQASTNIQIFVDLNVQAKEPKFTDQERSMIEEIRKQLEAKMLQNAPTPATQTLPITVAPSIPTPTPSTSSTGPPTSTTENLQRNIDLREQMQGTMDGSLARDRRIVNYHHPHPYDHDDRHLDRRGRGRGRSRGPIRRHFFDRDDYYY